MKDVTDELSMKRNPVKARKAQAEGPKKLTQKERRKLRNQEKADKRAETRKLENDKAKKARKVIEPENDAKALKKTQETTGKNAKVKAKKRFSYDSDRSKRNTSEKSKQDHYDKHKNEFKDENGNLKYKSAEEYEKGAQKFLNNPPEGTMTKVRKGSRQTVRYNDATKEYAVMDKEGKIETYMKAEPKNLENPNGFSPDEFIDGKDYFHAN